MSRSCENILQKDNTPLFLSSNKTKVSGPYVNFNDCDAICNPCTNYSFSVPLTLSQDYIGHDYMCCAALTVEQCMNDWQLSFEECQNEWNRCMDPRMASTGNFPSYARWKQAEYQEYSDCGYVNLFYPQIFEGLNSRPTGGSTIERTLNVQVGRDCNNNHFRLILNFSSYESNTTSPYQNILGGGFTYTISGFSLDKISNSNLSCSMQHDDYGVMWINGDMMNQGWHHWYIDNCQSPECQPMSYSGDALSYLNGNVTFGNWDSGGNRGVGGQIEINLYGNGSDISWFDNLTVNVQA